MMLSATKSKVISIVLAKMREAFLFCEEKEKDTCGKKIRCMSRGMKKRRGLVDPAHPGTVRP